MLQLCVTVQFYLENIRKIHLQGVRACRTKRLKEKREREGGRKRDREGVQAWERDPLPFDSSFYMFFPPLPIVAELREREREREHELSLICWNRFSRRRSILVSLKELNKTPRANFRLNCSRQLLVRPRVSPR